MRPLSFSDRYWFVKFTIGIIALVALVVIVLLSIKSCAQEPHTHTESDWRIIKAASCTTEGAQYKVCTGCGEQMKYEIIPAKGHKAGNPRKENPVSSTCTTLGSYDSVVYCTVCRVVLPEYSKYDVPNEELAKTTYGKAELVESEQPTHTKPGYEIYVKYCTVCKDLDEKCEEHKKVEKIILDPTGHDYSIWEPFFNEETNTVNLRGTCTCGEENNVNVFTPDNSGLVVSPRNESYAVCCGGEAHFTVKMMYNGSEITLNYNAPIESHKLYSYPIVVDGQLITGYVSIDEYLVEGKLYNGQPCYYYDGETYFAGETYRLQDYVIINPDSWTEDEDGNKFCIGSFVCKECEDTECATCNGAYIWIVLYKENNN